MTIRNPIEWGWSQVNTTADALGAAGRAVLHINDRQQAAPPMVRRITISDLRDVLARGIEDLGAYRTDVIFLCAIYPLIGLVLVRLAFGQDMLPLLFPLASGFALVGPVAAVGLYEISRRREQGVKVTWADAFGVWRSPSFAPIAVLSLLLLAIFAIWLLVAWAIYALTLGPQPPVSLSAFVRDVFTTSAGWTMIVVGVGVGFVFAVLVLTISVVSFPLLLDRQVGFSTAISTSVRAVIANPVPMAAWGVIVSAALVLGAIPVFIGLIVVLPVLGHSTWHLYRKLVPLTGR